MRRLAGGFLALVVLANLPVSRRSFTCVHCHLMRLDWTCLGLTSSTWQANECSRWYPAHVEPTHDHRWQPGTCRTRSNLLGFPLSVACTNGRPLHAISAGFQRDIYEHFDPPLAAKPLFESLQHATRPGARPTVEVLEAWAAAGWPGRWDDWNRGFVPK